MSGIPGGYTPLARVSKRIKKQKRKYEYYPKISEVRKAQINSDWEQIFRWSYGLAKPTTDYEINIQRMLGNAMRKMREPQWAI